MTKLLNAKDRFVDWVHTPVQYRPNQLGYYKFLALALLLNIVVLFSFAILYTETDVAIEPIGVSLEILSITFIPLLFLYAGIEEIMFRIIPLTWAMRNLSKKNTVILALISSIAFGFLHGGLVNIPLQGFSGLIYATIFLKYAQNGRYIEAGLLVTVVHTLYNGFIALFALSAGFTTL